MAVENDLDRAQYPTNGTTGPFTVPFYFLASADLAVTFTDAAGVDTVLELDVDYTVTGAGFPAGGTVTTATAYAAGGLVTIVRDLDFVQETVYEDGDSFPAKTHERALDRLTMMAQQLLERVKRAISFPSTYAGSAELGDAASRAGKLLGFDAVTGAITYVAAAVGSALDLAVQYASANGASLIGFRPAGSGAISGTVEHKLREVASFTDQGGATAASGGANAIAAAKVEALASAIYVPEGTFIVDGTYVFTKKWYGPGRLTYSGIGIPTFTGAGLNDVAFSGTFTGAAAAPVIVKINATGTPDQIAISYDAGATWVTTNPVYNPVTDAYDQLPILASTTPYAIGQGVSVAFGATTGHTSGAKWTVTLHPNPMVANINGPGYAINGGTVLATFGVQNLLIGEQAFGAGMSFGSGNVGVGYKALFSNTTGYANIGIGPNTLRLNTAGFFNVALGSQALEVNTIGYDNTALGQFAMQYNVTGFSNTALGSDVLGYNKTGNENTAGGVQACYTMVGGNRNTAFGLYSQRGGSASLRPIVTIQAGTLVNASTAVTLSAPNGAIAIFQAVSGVGIQPGTTVAAIAGTALTLSLPATSAGSQTLQFGYTDAQLSPSFNTSFGALSLYSNLSANGNTSGGYQSLYACVAPFNTALGANAGKDITSAQFGVFLGYQAGVNGGQSLTAFNMIAIGDNSWVTGQNGIAIGSAANAGTNEIVLGNASHTTIRPGADNVTSFGLPSRRGSVAYFATGAINTSDGAEKQQFTSMGAAERAVALDIKSSLGKFKFNDAVLREQQGGSSARWHFGAVAQEVSAAFAAHGLDAANYALFCSDTWTNEDGTQQTRLGLRYDELACFVLAAM